MKKFIFILIIAFAGFVIWNYATADQDQEIKITSSTIIATGRPAPEEAGSSSGAVSVPPVLAENISDTRYLELVNGDHPIGSDPDSDVIVPVWPGVNVLTTDITLNDTARESVKNMFETAKAEQAGSFYVSSGYRSNDEQTLTYEETEDKSLVQRPGYSEHQTGLAADIMAEGIGQFELAGSSQGKWLADNSWRFGLILRYADDRQEITGIAGEAWHFRYIGYPHSRICYENNLSLEEYIEFLRKTGGYTTKENGLEYTVTYRIPEDGKLPLPDGSGYSVSGDNTGGYVITETK